MSARTADDGLSDGALYRGKRGFDVVLGVILSLVTLPLVLGLALVSAMRFRSSPFFKQMRIGWGGKPYRVVKIRSLDPSVSEYADKQELATIRIDRWGVFLRRTHFDELPQLWQVVAGKMSLVGPRPMIVSIVDRMGPSFATLRHSVRPGLTGAWQVSEDGDHLVLGVDDYDIKYILHASLWIDARLLLITVLQVVGMSRLSHESVMRLIGIKPNENADAAEQRESESQGSA